MGGEMQALDEAAAASLVGWWLEAGVDAPISESPRDWLGRRKAAPAPTRVEAALSEPPADLTAFREWLATAAGLPMDRAGSVRITPHGT
jgi:hypothetical protein